MCYKLGRDEEFVRLGVGVRVVGDLACSNAASCEKLCGMELMGAPNVLLFIVEFETKSHTCILRV